ncbi:hypothetical protein B841_07580 [Corynebacterium maris DSM 45190]|uniref:DUF4190 domain-containing protein n=1 Tax=Corynebacterium maris DSM 45190 TaxID=1224163 RepID=S5SUZ4_9CORY|nr:DUF4190 domain-containing protein [Corynebacterium maris]AGS34989.1 hypothetical protein B841_07580 [Corynebacterium maris DSM 45190]
MTTPHDHHPPGEPVDYRDFQTDPSTAHRPDHPAAPKNRVAVWALIVAILGLLTGLTVLGATISFLIGLIALVLAIVAIRTAGKIPPQRPGRRLGMAWTALILSIFAILMSVFFYLTLFWLQQVDGIQDCLHLPTYEQRQVCLEQELTSGR